MYDYLYKENITVSVTSTLYCSTTVLTVLRLPFVLVIPCTAPGYSCYSYMLVAEVNRLFPAASISQQSPSCAIISWASWTGSYCSERALLHYQLIWYHHKLCCAWLCLLKSFDKSLEVFGCLYIWLPHNNWHYWTLTNCFLEPFDLWLTGDLWLYQIFILSWKSN